MLLLQEDKLFNFFHPFFAFPQFYHLISLKRADYWVFCFQTSPLPFTKKSETQNFHSLTMVCFERLIEQETEDEYENTK